MCDTSERALILAPLGRDAALAAAILAEARIEAQPCKDAPALLRELRKGGGFAVVAEEALRGADLSNVSTFLKRQLEWSDFQFILLTSRGGGLERNPAAARLLDVLGNVTFLERPFHPTTLVSLAQAALRGRRRQYEARNSLLAIRESEMRLRRAAEAAGFGIHDFDPARGETVWAGEMHRIFGTSGSGRVPAVEDVAATIHPEDREWVCAEMKEIQRRAGPFEIEYRIMRPSGEIRWIMDRGEAIGPVDAVAGLVAKVTGTVIDITERKQAEEALQEKTALLQAITESTPDLIFAKDREGRMLLVNPATLEMIGKTSADLLGLTEAEWHCNPGQAAAIMANDRRIMASGIAETVEEVFTSCGGEVRIFAGTKSPLLNAAGEAAGIVGVMRDVTALKQAERSLRESERRFRQVTESLPQLVWTSTPSGLCDYLSPQWCRYTGRSEEEHLGYGWLEQLHPADRERVMADWQATGANPDFSPAL
jgi:PAS domain S-box-containing protein